MLLHLLGMGGILDNALLWLFELPSQSKEMLLPGWVTFIYVVLSVGAIWRKQLFWLVLGLSSSYMIYLFTFI